MLAATAVGMGDHKSRGAYFTPSTVASFLVNWAVRSGDERILEPSCGEAAFLRAATSRLKQLGAVRRSGQLIGVDIDGETITRAATVLGDDAELARLIASDFFELAPPDELGSIGYVDAIVGNPPYIRYQSFTGPSRVASHRAALAAGVSLTNLASSWAATVVHASRFLGPAGRLAMVLPAELLTVNYAEPVRTFLRRRFGSVTLVLFEQLVFDAALEDVVLLLAEGDGGCDHFDVHHVTDEDQLSDGSLAPAQQVSLAAHTGKWLGPLLVAPSVRATVDAVTERAFVPLDRYGTPRLGLVTGNNRFFALRPSTVEQYGLEAVHLERMLPPSRRRPLGRAFTNSDWRRAAKADEQVYLLRLHGPITDLHPAAALVQLGVDLGVDQAYKCAIRDPWYVLPKAAAPDIFVTYMNHHVPRLVRNTAGVAQLNSLHGIVLTSHRRLAGAALPLLAMNSLTLLGGELGGRPYGGGVLKLEPREAASLPVPGPAPLAAAWAALRHRAEVFDRWLRAGDWQKVVDAVDNVLLGEVLEVSATDLDTVSKTARMLRRRRLRRASSKA